MGKILRILLVLSMVLVMVLAAVPTVQAAGPEDKVPVKVKEVLGTGVERVDQYSTKRVISTKLEKKKVGGKDTDVLMAEYETIISSLPQVTADGSVIDTKWYYLTDKTSGQTWFETGTNTFKSRVLEGYVTVEDKDGRLASWDSRVTVGGVGFYGGDAKISDDPINPNYKDNTLVWEYGEYNTAKGGKAHITRYLRVIEGLISELWMLPEEPSSAAVINLDKASESKFGSRINWLSAWDSKGKVIPITAATETISRIEDNQLRGLTYPIWIDPTLTLDEISSTSDGYAFNVDAAYNTARSAANADSVESDFSWMTIGQDTDFYVSRGYVYFDTSDIGATSTITSAAVYVRLFNDYSTTDFNVIVQSGQPTYPHDPLVVGDYNQANYSSSNGGQVSTSSMVNYADSTISLNSTGMSWINKTGDTKFLLRSSRDYAGNTPSTDEYITIRSREYGSGGEPKIRVVYTEPVVNPTVTTMASPDSGYDFVTFRGLLTSDGGESCTTRFKYDVSTAYGQVTEWQSGYETDDYFTATKSGLLPGTLYYFKAEADNSASGTGLGSGLTALTNPLPATAATATEGNTQVVLNWTKGTGAQKTMIRRATTGYPDTPSSGTQVYFDTAATKTDTGLTNGTLYYYSIWSYTTLGGLAEYSLDRTTVSATPDAPALATVSTDSATSIGAGSANINLSLTSLGGYGSADVSFEWATDAYYDANGSTYDESTTPETVNYVVATWTEPLAGLAAATQYHFRARAENTSGWAYGIDRTFTTGSTGAPEMGTNAASGVGLSSAQLNGVVTDDGGAPPVTAWFEYGLTTAYGSSSIDYPDANLSDGDTFLVGLTGLLPDTTYHFRSVGQNSVDIAYGPDANFTTDAPAEPTVETVGSSSVGTHQATLNGQVLTDGGVEVEVAFEYGTTVGYGTETDWVSGKSEGSAFSAFISGLDQGTTYHYRALARNSAGTGEGADATFATVFTAPTGFYAKAISYASINLEWVKQGDITCVQYSTDGYPLTRLDGTQAYYGPGTSASVSGLLAGTTYYFRAWTGAEGDIWAPTTAEAIATTYSQDATSGAAIRPTPFAGINPTDVPAQWAEDTTGANLKVSHMPLYAVLEVVRAGTGGTGGLADAMSIWTFYLILAVFVSIMFYIFGVLLAYKASNQYGSSISPWTAGAIFGAAAMALCAFLGMVSYFMILVYVVILALPVLIKRGQEG